MSKSNESEVSFEHFKKNSKVLKFNNLTYISITEFFRLINFHLENNENEFKELSINIAEELSKIDIDLALHILAKFDSTNTFETNYISVNSKIYSNTKQFNKEKVEKEIKKTKKSFSILNEFHEALLLRKKEILEKEISNIVKR